MALAGRRGLRSYLSGQDIALGVIAIPLLTAISFGLAAVAGRPGYGFLGMAVDLAALGAALAMSKIFTVVLSYPMDKRAGSPMRRASQGYGSYGLGGVLGTVACMAVAAIPVIVALLLTNSDPSVVRLPVLVPCAAASGFALAWIGVRIAASAAEDRLPELCQVAARSKL